MSYFDCLIQYDHLLTFTSEADGTLPCYDGGGHATDRYWIEGAATEHRNPDPFGECNIADGPLGLDSRFRIVRRMGG